MQSGLLIIDIQNDYFPGGNNQLTDPEKAAVQANKLLAAFRRKQFPIVHIRHISTRNGATFFLPGTRGSEIHKSVQPITGEPIIIKHFPNSFRDTGLLDTLRKTGIDRPVICGMMTHMCVDSTVRAAFDHGFNCMLASDACATKDLSKEGVKIEAEYVQSAFMHALSGMLADVKRTDEIIDTIEAK
ncbi:MAG TPA: cysteine hydrolase family protein [Methanocella sp.]|nr:cysteine hydrolase family protein [Methanocella sp.]